MVGEYSTDLLQSRPSRCCPTSVISGEVQQPVAVATPPRPRGSQASMQEASTPLPVNAPAGLDARVPAASGRSCYCGQQAVQRQVKKEGPNQGPWMAGCPNRCCTQNMPRPFSFLTQIGCCVCYEHDALLAASFRTFGFRIVATTVRVLGGFWGIWGISGEALFAAQALAKSCVRGDMHLLMRWLHSFGGVIELLWLQHLLCVRTASRRYELFNRQTQ